MNVQYIGSVPTKVRIGGVKIAIEPNTIFTMEDNEAKDLLSWPYNNIFIAEGTERPNPMQQEQYEEEIVIADGVDDKVTQKLIEILSRISYCQTMDELNVIATQVSGDSDAETNAEIAQALEAKVQYFLTRTEEEQVPTTETVETATETEEPQIQANVGNTDNTQEVEVVAEEIVQQNDEQTVPEVTEDVPEAPQPIETATDSVPAENPTEEVPADVPSEAIVDAIIENTDVEGKNTEQSAETEETEEVPPAPAPIEEATPESDEQNTEVSTETEAETAENAENVPEEAVNKAETQENIPTTSETIADDTIQAPNTENETAGQ